MSTALVNVDLTQLPSTQLGTDEEFEKMSRNTKFLGRLQLFTKGTAINEGLIPPGQYGIPESDKKIVNLGKQIDVLPLARRLKALDMSDKETGVIENFDPNSDQFKDIAARSMEQDSGCMCGTSFLVFERGSGRFLEFFCGTKSTQSTAGDIAAYMALSQADIDRKKANGADTSKMEPHGPLPCTFKVRLAKNKRGHSWHVPEVLDCSTPFQNLPPIEVIKEEMTKFLSRKNNGPEVVTEPEGKKARAR